MKNFRDRIRSARDDIHLGLDNGVWRLRQNWKEKESGQSKACILEVEYLERLMYRYRNKMIARFKT